MSSFDVYPNSKPMGVMQDNIYDPVARIVVIGVGGAGNNAINRMIDDGVKGVEFVGVNTDAQDLKHCKASKRVAIGEKVTGGRGCGAIPEVGESAANESKEAIRAILRETEMQKKADMVFITCGMGGGTGTGAAPIIASIAKEEGILTVAVVTKPFRFEGKTRMQRAINGINKLFPNVDTLINISNDKLLNIVDVKDGFKESFAKADEILKQSIRGITDLINLPALINLDFADVSTVMRNKGLAHIAIGEGAGENRVTEAIRKAVECPLLDTTIDGATDLIVSLSGEVSLIDVDAAMKELEPKLSEDVNIIFGAREDANLKDTVSVTLVATGIKDTSNTFSTYRQTQSFAYNPNARYGNFSTPSYMQNNMNMQQFSRMPQMSSPMQPESQMSLRTESPVSSTPNTNVENSENASDATKTGVNAYSVNPDSINVDMNKIGFSRKSTMTKDLLPSFITESFSRKKQ